MTKRLPRRHAPAGFTLIELLVVVLIIGILAAMAIPQYFKVVEKARTSEAKSFISALRSAQERYMARVGSYTDNILSLDISFPACSAEGDTCGLKTYNFNDMASINCTASPGYTIAIKRNSNGVAARYGAYSVQYNRCTDNITYSENNCNADFD